MAIMLPWFIKEFDLDAFSIMCSAGVYLIRQQPAAMFREDYLPVMRELVGAQRMANRQEEVYELFARTLASKVRAVFCDIFLHCFCSVLSSLKVYVYCIIVIKVL